MKIVIKTDKTNLTMPVPLRMAGFAIKNIPESTFEKLREKLPQPYAKALCKENLAFLFEETRDELEKYKGLEIIKARKEDGTYVSVVL